jgi:hypothetical protein
VNRARPHGIRLAAACLAALLAFGTAQALAAAPISVTTAKHKGGPYSSDAVTNANVPPGKTKSFFWKITTPGSSDLDVTLDDASTPDPNPDGFKIRWFRRHQEISSAVKGPGYEFVLPPDKALKFRAQVTGLQHKHFCLGGQFSITSPVSQTDAGHFAVNDPNACI